MVSHCAQLSHPPTHWHAKTCHLPRRRPSNSLYLSLGEWPRPPSTARIERPPSFPIILPSLLASLHWNGTRVDPTAAVERAHSDRARSGSKGSARVSFHPFHRARSASKEGAWPLPLHPSQAARCASTGIVPASPSHFQHPVRMFWPDRSAGGVAYTHRKSSSRFPALCQSPKLRDISP